jgi:hypothetical protein
MVRSTIMFASLSVVAALALPASAANFAVNAGFESLDGSAPLLNAGTGQTSATGYSITAAGGPGTGSIGRVATGGNPSSTAALTVQLAGGDGAGTIREIRSDVFSIPAVSGSTYSFGIDMQTAVDTFTSGLAQFRYRFVNGAGGAVQEGGFQTLTKNPAYQTLSFTTAAVPVGTNFGNTVTGAQLVLYTVVGANANFTSTFNFDNAVFDDGVSAPVPEPTALSVLGLGALVALRRKRCSI